MDLDDITKQSEFDFLTSAFGLVRISVLSTFDIDAAEEALDRLTPIELTRLIFTRLARPTTIAYEDHESLRSPEKHFDGEELSEDELEDFAQRIFKNYRYLASLGQQEWLAQAVGETNTELLFRTFEHHLDQREMNRTKLLNPVSSAIFSDASRRSWASSTAANARLGSTIQRMREERHFPTLPKLASQTTNELLGDLSQKLDAATPVVQDMASAILALEQTVRTMQADAVKNGVEADRKTLAANRMAGVGIFLSFAAIVISIIQMRDDSVVISLQELRADLKNERAETTRTFGQLTEQLKRSNESGDEVKKSAVDKSATVTRSNNGAMQDTKINKYQPHER